MPVADCGGLACGARSRASAIGAIAYQNKAKVYALLFNAAAETLTTIAPDRKHLGADQSSRMGC